LKGKRQMKDKEQAKRTFLLWYIVCAIIVITTLMWHDKPQAANCVACGALGGLLVIYLIERSQ
jgi:hypothetical protein